MAANDRLREERLRYELTLRDVAPAVGISVSYLSALERGDCEEPSLAVARRLAGYYCVSVDYLFPATGEDETTGDWRSTAEALERENERLRRCLSDIRAVLSREEAA